MNDELLALSANYIYVYLYAYMHIYIYKHIYMHVYIDTKKQYLYKCINVCISWYKHL
jgi:hypothetical protein